jgi:uncharacterized OsmC-like protein
MSSVAEALERARQIFLEKPAAARKPNAGATATWTGGLGCEITGPSGERAVTDMPPQMGGQGRGSNPGWLLRAAMVSCATTAIAMQAAMRGIAIEKLEVQVDSDSDARGLVGIQGVPMALQNLRMSVRLSASGADETVLREIATSACRASPVSATLGSGQAVAVDLRIE